MVILNYSLTITSTSGTGVKTSSNTTDIGRIMV